MAKLSIEDLELAGKRVFIRVDFNVPQDKVTGEITNTKRIEAALPTIQYALDKGAAVVLDDGEPVACGFAQGRECLGSSACDRHARIYRGVGGSFLG